MGWVMKSILNQALSRHEDDVKKESKAPKEEAARPVESADDDEIRKIVDSLDVSIKIVGCGGGGSNTINRCTEAGISGAQLCAMNTDAKHLLAVHAPKKILIGKRLTKGLGAGALPEVGEQAARESEEEIHSYRPGRPARRTRTWSWASSRCPSSLRAASAWRTRRPVSTSSAGSQTRPS
jgi:cell division protein FtsZ